MTDPRTALTALLKLTRELTEDRPLEALLSAVTDAALRLLPGDHASVRLLDDSASELLAGARSGTGLEHRPLSFRRGEGVTGWVVDHGRMARIDDVLLDPRFKRGTGQGFEIRSMLVAPLWSAGQVVGALAVSSPRVAAFSSDDELMTRLLANCAVPPIEKARLERLAVTDLHTRAYNQRFLLPRLHEETERARRYVTPLSLLLLDLDHFKRVNDEHGHDAGDLVLRGFADRVRETVRRADILVRRGGEEFVLIMPNTGPGDARSVAERVRRRLDEAPLPAGDGVTVHQTVSIGIATWDGVEEPEELERRADRAMYEAKRAGRNRVQVG